MLGRAKAKDHVKACVWKWKGLSIGNLELKRRSLALSTLPGTGNLICRQIDTYQAKMGVLFFHADRSLPAAATDVEHTAFPRFGKELRQLAILKDVGM